MKLNKRELKLVYITIAIAALFVFYQFLYWPKESQIRTLSADLDALKTNVQIAKTKASRIGSLEADQFVVQGKEVQIETIYQHLSNYLNMDVVAVKTREQEKTLLVDVTARGGFVDFYEYLESLPNLNLLIRVETVNLRPVEDYIEVQFTLASYL